MFINGLFHLCSDDIQGLLDWHFYHLAVFSDLGLGESVFAIKGLDRMVPFYTAETFVDTAGRVTLYRHCPVSGNTYKDTTTCAAETARCFFPSDHPGCAFQLFPAGKAYAGEQGSCSRYGTRCSCGFDK